ncbi:MAG: hypothetical protein ACN0LA_05370 [Candidatus Longimicrobiales bacterium M2_2A_002]
MTSTVRFFRQYLRPRAASVAREDTVYRRGDDELPASLYRPARAMGGAGAADRVLPGWVALHGLTYRGRQHESLDAFARALAASGAAVLVPDVPEWRGLRVAPGTTVATIRAAVIELDGRPFTAPGRVGVIGFSFGGTQALMASTAGDLDGRLAAVASWGGYAGLHRTLRFAFLGRHELDGETYRHEPDPYGRWIFTANYLTQVEEHADRGPAASALLWLAREVGRRQIRAWQPETDPLKEEAGSRLGPADRDLFDLVAPGTGVEPIPSDLQRLGVLADRLADAALETDPLLDPGPYLSRVPVPVFLAHGRGDRLIPWTELTRLRRALSDDRVRHSLVTRLFAHSFRDRRLPAPGVVVEAVRFVRAVSRMLRLI